MKIEAPEHSKILFVADVETSAWSVYVVVDSLSAHLQRSSSHFAQTKLSVQRWILLYSTQVRS